MRSEILPSLRHSRFFLEDALHKMESEWDDVEIMLGPQQVLEMRSEMAHFKKLLKEIEPYVVEFEKVATARRGVKEVV